MKLTRKQRLLRLCELDIDERLIDDKSEICYGKILKKVEEVISRNLGKKRNFKDSQLFEGEIRGKERLRKINKEKKMVKRISVVCIVAVLIVSMTGVLTYAMDMRGKISFGAYGGYTILNPAGINDVLNDIKDEYESWWDFGPDSGTVTPLTGGIGYGAEVRYGLTSNLIVGAGYSRMSGSGQVNWDGSDWWGFDWTGEWKDVLTVTGFTGSVLFATGSESSNFYFGGGAGSYSATITHTASDSEDWIGFYDKMVMQGKSTIGFHGIAGFEYFLSQNIAFAIEGMYSSVTFPGEWTFTEHPDPSWVGELSTTWTNPVQAGGITIGAGVRFYVG